MHARLRRVAHDGFQTPPRRRPAGLRTISEDWSRSESETSGGQKGHVSGILRFHQRRPATIHIGSPANSTVSTSGTASTIAAKTECRRHQEPAATGSKLRRPEGSRSPAPVNRRFRRYSRAARAGPRDHELAILGTGRRTESSNKAPFFRPAGLKISDDIVSSTGRVSRPFTRSTSLVFRFGWLETPSPHYAFFGKLHRPVLG